MRNGIVTRDQLEEDLARATDLIRIGEVTSIDPARMTCRVTFDDDGITSHDLPVLAFNTFSNQDFRLPDIGEDVLCLFLSTGQEEGFVLGSFYAGEVMPEGASKDVRSITFSDGTRLAYDRASHELSGTVQGTVKLECTGTAEISSDVSITLDAPQILLKGAISMQSRAGSATTATLSGTLNASEDVTADGISLHGHTHDGAHGETSPPK